MFPIGDSDPSIGKRGFAWVTWSLIILNVLVFLYELSLGVGVQNFIQTFGVVPHEILTGQDIPPVGPHPLWIQLITSMFIHGGWLHIIGNMAFLWVFGDDIEFELGPMPYLVFYLAAGIFAGLTQSIIAGADSTIPSVGASGAIAGVLGAYIVLYPTRQIRVWLPTFLFVTTKLSAFIMIGFWFVLQFMNGLAALSERTQQTGGVAVWAHVGGFVLGVVIGLIARAVIGVRGRTYA